MIVELFRGSRAERLLAHPPFVAEWQALYEHCPWATCFQSTAFVLLWYRHYGERFEPVVVVGRDPSRTVAGLLTLARERQGRAIVAAGDIHAEYQAWLSAPRESDLFVEEALGALATEFPRSHVRLGFVPPDASLGWAAADRAWGRRADVRASPRGLMAVGPGTASETMLGQKRYRSRLAWLERDGPLSFEQITTPAALGALLDESIDLHDLRQAAINDSMPFRSDPRKRTFHASLLERADLLHVTTLRAGPHLVSAQLNMLDRDRLLLCVMTHSPRYARYSPGTLHVLLLGREIARQGIRTIDLSPGGQYKDRFATRTDATHRVTVYFDPVHYVRTTTRRALGGLANRLLPVVGIQPRAVSRTVSAFRQGVSALSLPTARAALVRYVRRRLLGTDDLRIYTFDLKDVDRLPNPRLFGRDRIGDLLEYRWAGRGRRSPRVFFRDALSRLEDGHHCYTRVENGELVSGGWLAERRDAPGFPEADQASGAPPDAPLLYDLVIHPDYRDRDLYRAALSQMLHDCATIPEARYAHVAVRVDDEPARRIVEALGLAAPDRDRSASPAGRARSRRAVPSAARTTGRSA